MKQTLIFMVTNGAGLGHLTRGLAVARRLRKIAPHLEIVFFSTSLALEIIRNEGFMFHYVPTQKLMPDTMSATAWNNYMFRHLQEIITLYNPMGIVFDGAFPYGGVIANLKQYQQLKCVWIKREGYKENTSHMKGLEELFNLVIVPKEIGCMDKGTSKKKFCNPILFLEREEAHERVWVRQGLGVGKKENLVYIQLGAGNINPIEQIVERVITCLLKDTKNRILLGESPIGSPLKCEHPRIHKIRKYPNAQYFKGIDMAVSAAGYNTFYELTYFGVPTLYIPNEQVLKDDQKARAKLAEKKEIGLCLEAVTQEAIERGIDTLYNQREIFRQHATGLIKDNGAYEAAHYIAELFKK